MTRRWSGEVREDFRAQLEAWFDAASAVEPAPSGRSIEHVSHPVPFVVKRYPGNAWIAYHTKALRELRFYQRLAAAGVPVPASIGAAHDGRQAVLFLERVEGAIPLRQLMELDNRNMPLLDRNGARHVGSAELRSTMAGLGRLVRQVHEAGFWHRDLHVGNILWRSGQLWVTDVHRGRFLARLPEDARVEDLGFLFLSLREFVSVVDLMRVVVAYEGEGWARAKLRSALEAMGRAGLRYARDRQRRAMQQGSRFERRSGWWLVRGREPPSGTQREIKRAGRRRLLRLDGCAVKVYQRGVGRGLVELLTGLGTGEREWRHLEGFRVRSLAAPGAVGFRRRLTEEMVAYEWIEGARPLGEYLRERYGVWSKGERDAFLGRLARLVRRMHDRGVAHGDLKANNVLVREDEIWFIDLDRVREAAFIPPEAAERNLAELCAAVGPPVTPWDRLRFLKVYAGFRTRWNREMKAIARRIVGLAAKRRHVWPPEARRGEESAGAASTSAAQAAGPT